MKKGKFIEINFPNWKEEVYNGLIILDFWAEWCSACNVQDKFYKDLLNKFPEKLKIGKINVSDNKILTEKFRVKNIPYLILFNEGEEIARMEGLESTEYLVRLIEKELETIEK